MNGQTKFKLETLEPRLLLNGDGVVDLEMVDPCADSGQPIAAIEIQLDGQQVSSVHQELTYEAGSILEGLEEVVLGEDVEKTASEEEELDNFTEIVTEDLSGNFDAEEEISEVTEVESEVGANSEEKGEIQLARAAEYDDLSADFDTTNFEENDSASKADELVETLHAANGPPAETADFNQVIYLNFDGASDVSYNGPVRVEGLNVPSFCVPRGERGEMIAQVLASLNDQFYESGVTFTSVQPISGDYSTIYVGGDDSAFAEYGSFLGLAEQVDVGNQDRTDNAFVFSENVYQSGECRNPQSLISVIAHETGHLLGYEHEAGYGDGVLSAVANEFGINLSEALTRGGAAVGVDVFADGAQKVKVTADDKGSITVGSDRGNNKVETGDTLTFSGTGNPATTLTLSGSGNVKLDFGGQTDGLIFDIQQGQIIVRKNNNQDVAQATIIGTLIFQNVEVDQLLGGLGNDRFVVSSFNLFGGDKKIDGGPSGPSDPGPGRNTFEMADIYNTVGLYFEINDTNEFDVAAKGGTVADPTKGTVEVEVKDVQNIKGTAQDDVFKFGNRDSLIFEAGDQTGCVDAGGGNDILDLKSWNKELTLAFLNQQNFLNNNTDENGILVKRTPNGLQESHEVVKVFEINTIKSDKESFVSNDEDALDFSSSTQPVKVNLSTTANPVDTTGIAGAPQPGEIIVGTIKIAGVEGFENVIGGSGDDVLVASSTGSVLKGGPGDDKLCGGKGDDTLQGDAGDDTLKGGGGKDKYVFGVKNHLVASSIWTDAWGVDTFIPTTTVPAGQNASDQKEILDFSNVSSTALLDIYVASQDDTTNAQQFGFYVKLGANVLKGHAVDATAFAKDVGGSKRFVKIPHIGEAAASKSIKFIGCARGALQNGMAPANATLNFANVSGTVDLKYGIEKISDFSFRNDQNQEQTNKKTNRITVGQQLADQAQSENYADFFTADNIRNLVGGKGNNHYKLTGTGDANRGFLSGTLTGGSADQSVGKQNILDYLDYDKAVRVNLTADQVTFSNEFRLNQEIRRLNQDGTDPGVGQSAAIYGGLPGREHWSFSVPRVKGSFRLAYDITNSGAVFDAAGLAVALNTLLHLDATDALEAASIANNTITFHVQFTPTAEQEANIKFYDANGVEIQITNKMAGNQNERKWILSNATTVARVSYIGAKVVSFEEVGAANAADTYYKRNIAAQMFENALDEIIGRSDLAVACEENAPDTKWTVTFAEPGEVTISDGFDVTQIKIIPENKVEIEYETNNSLNNGKQIISSVDDWIDADSFQLSFNREASGDFQLQQGDTDNRSNIAQEIQTFLNGSNAKINNATAAVVRDGSNDKWIVTFSVDDSQQQAPVIPQITIGYYPTPTRRAGVAAVNEVWDIYNQATGGTFKLEITLNNIQKNLPALPNITITTEEIAYNASAWEIKEAIENAFEKNNVLGPDLLGKKVNNGGTTTILTNLEGVERPLDAQAMVLVTGMGTKEFSWRIKFANMGQVVVTPQNVNLDADNPENIYKNSASGIGTALTNGSGAPLPITDVAQQLGGKGGLVVAGGTKSITQVKGSRHDDFIYGGNAALGEIVQFTFASFPPIFNNAFHQIVFDTTVNSNVYSAIKDLKTGQAVLYTAEISTGQAKPIDGLTSGVIYYVRVETEGNNVKIQFFRTRTDAEANGSNKVRIISPNDTTTTHRFHPVYTLNGEAGNDKIYADVKDGDDRANALDGGEGSDLLVGGNGADYLSGEGGQDDYLYGDGAHSVAGAGGNDEGNDILKGGDGPDYIYGYIGTDYLEGGDGDDWLYGGMGSDIVIGGRGDDTLAVIEHGVAGDYDLFKGGEGNDKYVFKGEWGVTNIVEEEGGGEKDDISLSTRTGNYVNILSNGCLYSTPGILNDGIIKHGDHELKLYTSQESLIGSKTSSGQVLTESGLAFFQSAIGNNAVITAPAAFPENGITEDLYLIVNIDQGNGAKLYTIKIPAYDGTVKVTRTNLLTKILWVEGTTSTVFGPIDNSILTLEWDTTLGVNNNKLKITALASGTKDIKNNVIPATIEIAARAANTLVCGNNVAAWSPGEPFNEENYREQIGNWNNIEEFTPSMGANTFVFGNDYWSEGASWSLKTLATLASGITGGVFRQKTLEIDTEKLFEAGLPLNIDFRQVNTELLFSFEKSDKDGAVKLKIQTMFDFHLPVIDMGPRFQYNTIVFTHVGKDTEIYTGRYKNTIEVVGSADYQGQLVGGEGWGTPVTLPGRTSDKIMLVSSLIEDTFYNLRFEAAYDNLFVGISNILRYSSFDYKNSKYYHRVNLEVLANPDANSVTTEQKLFNILTGNVIAPQFDSWGSTKETSGFSGYVQNLGVKNLGDVVLSSGTNFVRGTDFNLREVYSALVDKDPTALYSGADTIKIGENNIVPVPGLHALFGGSGADTYEFRTQLWGGALIVDDLYNLVEFSSIGAGNNIGGAVVDAIIPQDSLDFSALYQDLYFNIFEVSLDDIDIIKKILSLTTGMQILPLDPGVNLVLVTPFDIWEKYKDKFERDDPITIMDALTDIVLSNANYAIAIGVENIAGSRGWNKFTLYDGAKISGRIEAGFGGDVELDYSRYYKTVNKGNDLDDDEYAVDVDFGASTIDFELFISAMFTEEEWGIILDIFPGDGLQFGYATGVGAGSMAIAGGGCIIGTEYRDRLIGNNTSDNTITGDEGNDYIRGATADDTLYGGDGDDEIYGCEGNLSGNLGDHQLAPYYKEGDNDTIYGGAGDDKMWGEFEDDVIFGDKELDDDGDLIDSTNSGNDQLYGGSGDDTLIPGAGNDTVDGEDDTDVYAPGTNQVLLCTTEVSTVSTTTQGNENTNEVQELYNNASQGYFTITFDGQTTALLDYNASASTIETELENLSNITNVAVIGTGIESDPWIITFNDPGYQNVSEISATDCFFFPESTVSAIITVSTTTQGNENTNEVQKFYNNANFGYFTITFDGQTTELLDYNASASDVETELENLSNITNVTVTGTGIESDPWVITFNDPGYQDVSEITATDYFLFLESTVSTTTQGKENTNEVQELYNNASQGYFTITFDGQTTVLLAYNASAPDVETELENLSNITNVTVTGTGIESDPWIITFNDPGYQNVSEITATVSATTQGNATKEVQMLYNDASQGSFTITFNSRTTGTLNYNASASEVESRLENLNNITGVTVIGRGIEGDPWIITFDDPGKGNVAQIITQDSFASSGSSFANTTTEGNATNEVQKLYNAAIAGSFTITFVDQTTGSLAYNASASTVATALENLNNITDVTVTGRGDQNDPWIITFEDPGKGNVAQITTTDAFSITETDTLQNIEEVRINTTISGETVAVPTAAVFVLNDSNDQTFSLNPNDLGTGLEYYLYVDEYDDGDKLDFKGYGASKVYGIRNSETGYYTGSGSSSIQTIRFYADALTDAEKDNSSIPSATPILTLHIDGFGTKIDSNALKFVEINSSSLLAEEANVAGATRDLEYADLDLVVAEAVARWLEATGHDSTVAERLNSLTFAIADLPDRALAQTYSTIVYVDADAAGNGWFVDLSVGEDSEFTLLPGASYKSAAYDSPAYGTYDLLTVVMHEMGHTLGLTDIDQAGALMNQQVSAGTRKMITVENVSQIDLDAPRFGHNENGAEISDEEKIVSGLTAFAEWADSYGDNLLELGDSVPALPFIESKVSELWDMTGGQITSRISAAIRDEIVGVFANDDEVTTDDLIALDVIDLSAENLLAEFEANLELMSKGTTVELNLDILADLGLDLTSFVDLSMSEPLSVTATLDIRFIFGLNAAGEFYIKDPSLIGKITLDHENLLNVSLSVGPIGIGPRRGHNLL